MALAKKGAVIALLARRRELLDDLAARCEAAGGTARVFVADVTDAETMQKAAQEFRDEFGGIDIMIANAGIGGNNEKCRSLQPDAVREVIETNLMGAVNAVHAVLPEMLRANSGHLVAISSLAGFRGLPRSAAYSASKAAMTNYFESIRLDTADKGIAVTIIRPGFIKTPLTGGRDAKMPFLMELDAAVPHFLRAIERKKAFAAFPWQLAMIVRLGRLMPAWLYDKIAGRARYRE
ncbi:MAG: SDR family NAD(P)-dependent oxidoreductase [Chloracidobacterium sp.]|nr:SDR family NAD(P)-dependent oxidoreductase [Chloracidobacterium sp.]MCO5332597.1 SDR family NAD(P)-dependent oxidoreductase [Pyrinomonadaceae bacterium]